MSLSIAGLVFRQMFAMADTGIDGILGLDFMKKKTMIVLIDLPNSSLRIKRKQVKLFFREMLAVAE